MKQQDRAVLAQQCDQRIVVAVNRIEEVREVLQRDRSAHEPREPSIRSDDTAGQGHGPCARPGSGFGKLDIGVAGAPILVMAKRVAHRLRLIGRGPRARCVDHLPARIHHRYCLKLRQVAQFFCKLGMDRCGCEGSIQVGVGGDLGGLDPFDGLRDHEVNRMKIAPDLFGQDDAEVRLAILIGTHFSPTTVPKNQCCPSDD